MSEKGIFFLIKAGSSTIELIHLCFFFSQKSQDFLTYLLIVTFLIEIIDPLPDEMRIQQLAAAYLPIWSVSKNIWISLKAAVYSLSIEALKRRLDIRLQPHPPAARVSSKTLGLGAPVFRGQIMHTHGTHAQTHRRLSSYWTSLKTVVESLGTTQQLPLLLSPSE